MPSSMQRILRPFTRAFHQRDLRFYTNYGTKKKIGWFGYATLICPLTCFGLGYWQVQRRKWKLDLIDRIHQNMNSQPIQLPSTAKQSTDLPEYSPVIVRGHFDHSREVLIGPRPLLTHMLKDKGDSIPHWLSSHGYLVVTPFFLADRPGSSILVNRGWIPLDKRDPATRPKGQVSGTIELTGVVRYPDKPLLVSPRKNVWPCEESETQASQTQFFGRHTEEMAEKLGTLPLFIDANFDSTVSGGPVGGQTLVQLRNEHASYIFTWFSLGVFGSILWVYYFLIV